ncbi:J domain-containing protein [Aquimonas voraii]|uniref:DnaJ domain-containing protein n=1 Tax=Aquimonas voraii TaxID=265719 RepID=A0A1G6X5W2_9GAMM|nr:J domain-containing protein [Aquimonas voraii]SDD72686.1 DnaJ domain-containing protein [Aquimonas voraii]
MRYAGRLLGFSFGWILLRHPAGAVLGFLIGWGFDGGWLALRSPRPARGEDPYAVLEVAPEASMDEIDRAYRRAMSRHHPDRVANESAAVRRRAEARARAINAAYDRIRAEREG